MLEYLKINGGHHILQDQLHFYSSFYAFCTDAFRSIPLNVIQVNWFLMCKSKGFG